MTADIKHLDAHEQPSDELRAKWKAFSRAEPKDLVSSKAIDDLQDPETTAEFCIAGTIPVDRLNRSFRHICPSDAPEFQATKDAPIYYHPLLPGLLILPSLVPPQVQRTLLNHLIHRDLSNPTHQTNLHLHFNLPYPSSPENKTAISTGTDNPSSSFFTYPPSSPTSSPQRTHPSTTLTIKQVLDRKLHWVTLGGQYDWTNRVYPECEAPPAFPADVAGFLETLFPHARAGGDRELLYPGDTMMMHRDVSEETNKGLDGEDEAGEKAGAEEAGRKEKEFLLLRLRSGDAIYMTKDSRFAWHGVPKVLKGTCPEYLKDWPAEGGEFEEWRGWMGNKRINLNVRQMRD
ncbi:hypothetical protein NEMBOFW57_008307 [Staphylotrichum longicolle]|uniref:Alpha-ketoglutarate-dependent dioxygenase AlkB-like domain-containing protein n=1 Tax=Staphylotrichum longicolle TaxID=669026 RepID=A0AAD4ERQ6_9PEZI|nr:hypothetical protein NEMBOFW57_008307 [Staphylotrichum longicolle]